jgi:signal transduction histidine kinase
VKDDPTELNVAVVDDDELVRSTITAYLEDSGYKVSTAANGQEGLELYEQLQPDIVLLDLRMPIMDGFALLQAVRQRSPEVPIIVISGTGVICEAINAMKMGAWDFITKPIQDMEVLDHVLERALERRRLMRENRRYQERLEEMVEEKTRQLEDELRARLEAEEKFQRAQRMEAIGQLASGIAHDFNNVLTAIRGNAELARLEVDGSGVAAKMLEEIQLASSRATDLTRKLLSFGRRGATHARIDVNAICSEVAAMIRPMLDRNIDIELRLADEPLWVQGDATALHSVLLNLVVNARDAMPDGGRLSLMTELLGHPAGREVDGGAESWVKLSVADTGCGMDEETCKHMFEPFYTTKDQGKGTGLGLVAVLDCVQNHDGQLTVKSRPGEGSTFEVRLPAASAGRPKPTKRSEILSNPESGSANILIVDDEEIIRNYASRVLRRLGYAVWEAADGLDALRKLESVEPGFDVVLLDMNMPRAGGTEILDHIPECSPRSRVVICTGYADSAFRKETPPCVAGFLAKPFGMAEVKEAVVRALSSPHSLP